MKCLRLCALLFCVFVGRVVACVACFSVSASTSLLGRSASSACDSINLLMLETGEIYLTTTDIARDTYSVCQVLARAFKQYKNEKGKFYLRCKDCEKADCFIVLLSPLTPLTPLSSPVPSTSPTRHHPTPTPLPLSHAHSTLSRLAPSPYLVSLCHLSPSPPVQRVPPSSITVLHY